MGGLVGPIYSEQKHNFSDGYNAPKARSESKEREEKQKALVGKFFNQAEKRKETTKAAKAKFEQMASEVKEVKTSSFASSSFSASSSTQVSASKVEKRNEKSIEKA